MSWYTTLLPVGTLVLGAGLTEVRSWVADRRQRGEAERMAAVERQRTQEERRETFELDLLVRLQEALLEYGRATGRLHHIDMMISKQTGSYASTQLPEEASDHEYAAGRQMLALMNMVLDIELRQLVREAYTRMSAVGSMHRSTPQDAEDAFTAAATLHAEALEAVATRIRDIYLHGSADLPEPGHRADRPTTWWP